MPRCDGRGDGGDHCCYIEGSVCEFLVTRDGTPRCGLLLALGSWDRVHDDPRWKAAPIGRVMDREYPGYGCGDWPQNIPADMTGANRCCFTEGTDG